MRIFIAVSVPEHVKQYAKAVKDRLRAAQLDVKWVEYENYHLTLKFLGEVPSSRLKEIKPQLLEAGQEAAPLQLSVGTMGFFPNRNRPRVIFLDLQGELEKIQRLGETIDSRLSALGFEAEQKRRFHLTLGRFRSDRGSTQVIDHAALHLEEAKIPGFRVDKFYLMESILSERGPEYRVQQVIPLKGEEQI